jgi:hypothetical protein
VTPTATEIANMSSPTAGVGEALAAGAALEFPVVGAPNASAHCRTTLTRLFAQSSTYCPCVGSACVRAWGTRLCASAQLRNYMRLTHVLVS